MKKKGKKRGRPSRNEEVIYCIRIVDWELDPQCKLIEASGGKLHSVTLTLQLYNFASIETILCEALVVNSAALRLPCGKLYSVTLTSDYFFSHD